MQTFVQDLAQRDVWEDSIRTLPGKKTSTVCGISHRQDSGGNISTVSISGGITTGSSELVVGIGVRAHRGRVGGAPSSPGRVSTGRLTAIFFPF